MIELKVNDAAITDIATWMRDVGESGRQRSGLPTGAGRARPRTNVPDVSGYEPNATMHTPARP